MNFLASNCDDNDSGRHRIDSNSGAPRSNIASPPGVVLGDALQPDAGGFEDRGLGLLGGHERPDLRIDRDQGLFPDSTSTGVSAFATGGTARGDVELEGMRKRSAPAPSSGAGALRLCQRYRVRIVRRSSVNAPSCTNTPTRPAGWS